MLRTPVRQALDAAALPCCHCRTTAARTPAASIRRLHRSRDGAMRESSAVRPRFRLAAPSPGAGGGAAPLGKRRSGRPSHLSPPRGGEDGRAVWALHAAQGRRARGWHRTPRQAPLNAPRPGAPAPTIVPLRAFGRHSAAPNARCAVAATSLRPLPGRPACPGRRRLCPATPLSPVHALPPLPPRGRHVSRRMGVPFPSMPCRPCRRP